MVFNFLFLFFLLFKIFLNYWSCFSRVRKWVSELVIDCIILIDYNDSIVFADIFHNFDWSVICLCSLCSIQTIFYFVCLIDCSNLNIYFSVAGNWSFYLSMLIATIPFLLILLAKNHMIVECLPVVHFATPMQYELNC